MQISDGQVKYHLSKAQQKDHLFPSPKYHWPRVKIWITSCAQLPRIAVFVYTSVWPFFRSCPGLSRPSDEVWQQVPWLSQISTTTRALLSLSSSVPVLVAIVDTWTPGRGAMSGICLFKILVWPGQNRLDPPIVTEWATENVHSFVTFWYWWPLLSIENLFYR